MPFGSKYNKWAGQGESQNRQQAAWSRTQTLTEEFCPSQLLLSLQHCDLANQWEGHETPEAVGGGETEGAILKLECRRSVTSHGHQR